MWPRRKKPKEIHESLLALSDATANLHRVAARGPEVTEVSTSLKTLRVENHFREQLENIMKGRT